MKDLRKGSQLRPALAENIRRGVAVPILSDEAVLDLVLPGHQSLAHAYAEYIEYTLDDRDNLPRMARFYKLKRQKEALLSGGDFTNHDLRADFLQFVKNLIYDYAEQCGVDADTLAEAEAQHLGMTVTEFASLLGYPRLDRGERDPLLVLADLPFRVLLTTSPYTFLEKALAAAGKEPCTTVIRWRKDLRDLIRPSDDQSHGQEHRRPLVCHLFGLEDYPSSLVLTDDDYLDFVVNVNIARGDESRDSVPAQVRQALSRDLLVLGFSLNSWAFRALYAGLVKSDDARDARAENRGICVQLPPSKVEICVQLPPSKVEAEQNYLHDYQQREAHFEVVWKDLNKYAEELLTL